MKEILMKQTGGCHCGAVRFEANIEGNTVLSCNCSICMKMGSLLFFISDKDFNLLSGTEQLVDYQFNKNIIHHLFCKTCGIHPFGRAVNQDGSEGVAINMRCVDDIELAAYQVQHFDGKSL